MLILTVFHGDDNTGKAGFAFCQAAHSVIMGSEVMIFFVLEGSKFAHQNYGCTYTHACFEFPTQHLETFFESGGTGFVCCNCAEINENAGLGPLRNGVIIGGIQNTYDFINKPGKCVILIY